MKSKLRPLLTPCVLLCVAASQVGQTAARPPAAQAAQAQAARTSGTFTPGALSLLPLTAIKPQGWLRRQLEIQAAGLSGHIDEFWPDLGPDSGWLGGAGESWERGPYFLDGLVPLAYLLDDARLIAKARKWVEWTLAHQTAEGWIGPEKNTDWWPNMVMLKALAQYHEATGDARVLRVMEKYWEYRARHLDARPLAAWAAYRWGDELLSVLWLYRRNGDARLLDLARRIKAQGFDWRRHFEHFEFTTKTSKASLGLRPDMSNTTPDSMRAHGVNNAMALKYPALWSQVSGERADREAIHQMLGMLDRYHPQPNGMYSGDEHYAGPDPAQGIELCAVVEAMFSLEHAAAVLGDARLADRLEKISFNALPATFSGDMWSHQYDQQPNQVLCNVHPRAWTTNGPESNVFGLEPNFGCCAANMHQGWPKLAASLWMASEDGGLAAVVYAPSEVKTRVRGVGVNITEATDYPFRDEVRLTVSPEAPVTFPLRLRIPAWAAEARVTVNGRSAGGVRAGEFHRVEREWRRGDRVEVKLPMRVASREWPGGGLVLERGPLVYALGVGEDWRKITQGMRRPAVPPAADWEVRPTTPWNYALRVDPSQPQRGVRVVEKPVGAQPFTPAGAPVELIVTGRRLPEWQLVNGSAGPVPGAPVTSREPTERLTLIPYGAAKLRITVFPRLKD
jgi:uncharacterized protein